MTSGRRESSRGEKAHTRWVRDGVSMSGHGSSAHGLSTPLPFSMGRRRALGFEESLEGGREEGPALGELVSIVVREESSIVLVQTQLALFSICLTGSELGLRW